MQSNQKTTLRLLAGILFLGGSVYMWGAYAFDPQGIERLLMDLEYRQLIQIFARYVVVWAVCTVFGIGLLIAGGFKQKFNRINGDLWIAIALFSLIMFPPRWIMTGFKGVILSLIMIIQNFSAITGICLTAVSISEFLNRIKLKLSFPKTRNPFRLMLLASLFSITVYLISDHTFGKIPHIGDGAIQLFGAKIMASGHFTVPAPDNIEFFFDPFLVVKDGRWFTQYPAGYQMMLVPFVLLNIPAVLNPMLAGLTMIIFLLLCDELNLSRWWGLTFVLSPFVIFMSASFMNHPSAMFFAALGIFAFLKSGRYRPGWMFLWGLAGGLMFSVRPYTAICFHLPLIIIALKKRVGSGVLMAVIGSILGSAPYFINNYFTTGSIFVSGYEAAWDGATGLFFSESQWGPKHSPQLGLLHLAILLNGLNIRLFELPIPALIGVVLWLVLRRDKNWKEWTLFWAGLCAVAGYFFYFYVDMTLGPRFAYTAALPMLLLTGLGFKALNRKLRDSGWKREKIKWSGIAAFIILLCLWIFVSLPVRIEELGNRYRDVDADFLNFIKSKNLGKSIVFLDDYPSTDRHSKLYSLGFSNRQAWFYAWRLSNRAVDGALKSIGINPQKGFGHIAPLNRIGLALNQYWGNPAYLPDIHEDLSKPHIPLKQGLIYMSPDIDSNEIIFARDFGAHNAILMDCYPDRNYYAVDLTKNGYTLRRIER